MVVIFVNFFKAMIMLILAFGRGLREARVQTIGDAIASFFIEPDHRFKGRCLHSASDFKQAGLRHPRGLIFTKKSMRFSEKRMWLNLAYIL
jgi:hypothetical protein